MTGAPISSVIPAKAGIHMRDSRESIEALAVMDSRLRGNDDVFGMTDAR